ncbi:MBL fold metallo-hydrolase [Aquincola sp. MAHUQ-54]|uniref:MBL fold metallo-hydrolase n=1 Tax=Aquincola agrisoli TaxID=3119538 RepID=A0AAW9QS52_9BURK
MLRFRSLGSGSTGNGTLIETTRNGRTTRLLVDCGFSLRELTRRLAPLGVAPEQIDAVFVTHEHGDHVGCALQLARRHRVPVWASLGTWEAMERRSSAAAPAAVAPAAVERHVALEGVAIAVGGLEITPFGVPHDAAEPLQLRCTDGLARLGVLTDLGAPTDSVVGHLRGCHALLLECNHDSQMLADGPYPPFLKRRVGGVRGHLANSQAAELLQACLHGGLRHVVAAHLSQQNNTPALAAQALATPLGCLPAEIVVADAREGSPWLDVA